jgi:hypothetical protein
MKLSPHALVVLVPALIAAVLVLGLVVFAGGPGSPDPVSRMPF